MSGSAPDASHGLQPRLRSLARQALITTAGSQTDTSRIASGFNALRVNLGRGLEPLVGRVAVDALFERSLHLANGEFDWMSAVFLKPFDQSGNELSVNPDTLPSAGEFVEGLAAILAHIVALLISFLGEDLVMPIVQRAWRATNGNTTDESS